MRHGHPQIRPKRLKNGDDDDDEPTYVDEESHDTISKADYQAMVGKAAAVGDPEANVDPEGNEKAPGNNAELDAHTEQGQLVTSKDKLIDVGARKKRKPVKVVGADLPLTDTETSDLVASEPGEHTNPRFTAPRTKRKKMKLSFDD